MPICVRICSELDSIYAYRAAVTINFMLMIIAYAVLMRIIMTFQKEKKVSYAALISGIAILYPSWLYYSRSTMTEILVMSMYIVICMLMSQYLEKGKKKVLIALILSLVYIYTVHMRTIGIVIAACITLTVQMVTYWKQSKKTQVLLIIIFGIGLFLTATQLKTYITGNIYTDNAQQMITYNDYSGQISKIKGIFSLTGIRNLMISFVCKVWYLGLASFGLFYWGIAFCVKRLKEHKKLIYLFILLATAGEIAVTAIYTTGIGSRIDGLTYGRYNEQILPVLMALGCMAVMQSTKVVKPSVMISGLQLPLLVLILYLIRRYDQTNIHAYMILGISYLFNDQTFEPLSYHITAYVLSVILMAVVIMILRIGQKKSLPILLAIIMTMELLLGMRLAAIFSENTQMANFRDIQLINIVEQQQEEYNRLVYVQEGDRSFADYLQFRLRDAQIELLYDDSELTDDDLIVTDYLYSGIEKLKIKYANWKILGHLAVFYN